MKIKLLVIFLLTMSLSACYYQNLNLGGPSYLIEAQFGNRLKEYGIVSIECPLPQDAYTACRTLDESGFEASFVLPIRIEWRRAMGMKMTESAMSRFTPEELLQLIVSEHRKDRVDPERIKFWKESFPGWEVKDVETK